MTSDTGDTRRRTVVLAGAVAQKPGHGGHTWVFLQYLLGFKRLGWDVLFVDSLDPKAPGAEAGARYLEDVMKRFALADSYSLLANDGGHLAGLSRADVIDRVRNSRFLLNVMGFLDDEELLDAAPLRVFLDIDPGFGQMWRELGLADVFAGHDAFVTIAERIGQDGCSVPTCGIEWITTRQPVVLDLWPPTDRDGGPFTSVGSWRGRYAPVEYDGRSYGLRVHEFRKFLELPRRTGRRFELALEIDPTENADLERLEQNGWTLVDPRAVGGDPVAYRRYIQSSKAEFMVAKAMYVETRSGWFSDRSICYLASGKPVLAQDTGLDGLYPSGDGLLTFATLDDALAGVEEIERDYDRHARAARALAEKHFDSDKVLTRLTDALGVS